MNKGTIWGAMACLGGALLSGCGGDSGSDVTPTTRSQAGANPSLGLIQNATVNFYRADNASLLGSDDTGTDGVVSGTISGYSGPVVIEVVGDDIDARYYDESLGSYRPFSAGNSLHALSPTASGAFAVTPLTEIAYQGAVANGLFPISAQAVQALNDEVRSSFAPFISDILAPPTLFDSTTTTGDLADTDAGRYALLLAAFAELGSGEADPALAVLNALLEDLEDGVIDGDNDDGAVATPYSPGSFAADLATEMGNFATSFGTGDLQTAAGGFSVDGDVDFSGIENPDPGGPGGGCDSECQAFFTDKADTYTGVPDESVENGALASEFSGAEYEVVISTDGQITVSGETTDFSFAADEITGFDASTETNVFYSDVQSGYDVILQEDGGAFFININEPFEPGDVIAELANATLDLSVDGGGGEPAITNLEKIQALAGTYPVSAQVTGGTGTHTRGTVIIDASGNIDFDSGTAFTASTDYETIYDRLFIEQDANDIAFGPAYYVSMVFPDNGLDDGDRLDIFFSDDSASTVTAFKYAPVTGTTVTVGVAPE